MIVPKATLPTRSHALPLPGYGAVVDAGGAAAGRTPPGGTDRAAPAPPPGTRGQNRGLQNSYATDQFPCASERRKRESAMTGPHQPERTVILRARRGVPLPPPIRIATVVGVR